MTTPSKSATETYYQLYRGRTLLVSLIGRTTFSAAEYKEVMDDVADLVRRQINILLVSNTQLNEMAFHMVDHFGAEINEVLIINHQGGVRDSRGQHAPLLTLTALRQILAGTHPRFTRLIPSVRAQLEQVVELLPRVGKVSLISPKGLKAEIVNWRGSGTMCIDVDQLVLAPLPEIELPIFLKVHESYVSENKFRVRSQRELDEAGRNHFVLRAKNSPIAGFSLIDCDPNWLEFCVWWAQYKGDGFGSRVLEGAKKEAQRTGRRLFALSTEHEAVEVLERNGFQNLGRLSQLKAKLPLELPQKVRTYDTAVRDPQVLIEELPKPLT